MHCSRVRQEQRTCGTRLHQGPSHVVYAVCDSMHRHLERPAHLLPGSPGLCLVSEPACLLFQNVPRRAARLVVQVRVLATSLPTSERPFSLAYPVIDAEPGKRGEDSVAAGWSSTPGPHAPVAPPCLAAWYAPEYGHFTDSPSLSAQRVSRPGDDQGSRSSPLPLSVMRQERRDFLLLALVPILSGTENGSCREIRALGEMSRQQRKMRNKRSRRMKADTWVPNAESRH